ncbi:hypothetical protein BHE74_00054472, partial [Ensete ventricosum]
PRTLGLEASIDRNCVSPPSSAKNIMKLYVMAKESTRLGSACVCNLIRIDWEEVGKLGRGRLGLLENVPWLVCSGARLDLLIFGVCRGILHEGLVGVRALDVISPTIKLVPRPR